jgi:RHS repeat-associated protein
MPKLSWRLFAPILIIPSLLLSSGFCLQAFAQLERHMPLLIPDEPPGVLGGGGGGGGDGRPPICSIGTLPGDFEVDGFGQANYTIPLDVPPGTHDIEPKISLHYASFNPNGPLGMGWQIGGLSSIARCGASVAEDGYISGIQNDSDDRFCLDGTRLVAVSGSYGNNGTEYKTSPDRVMRIHSYGNVGSSGRSGPKYFKVETRDGLTLEYGGNDSYDQGRIEEGSSDLVRLWALSRVTDRFGNYMDFIYGENTQLGEYWIDEIRYTGHCVDTPPPLITGGGGGGLLGGKSKLVYGVIGAPSSNSVLKVGTKSPSVSAISIKPIALSPIDPVGCQPHVDPYNRVKFNYTDSTRPDSLRLYAAGSATYLHKRLSSIATYAGADPTAVSVYNLNYETSQATYLSRLNSVQRCDSNNICLPATKITWTDPLSGALTVSAPTIFGSGYSGTETTTGWWFGDQPYANLTSSVMGMLSIAAGGIYPSASPHFSRGPDGKLSTSISLSYVGVSYAFGYGQHSISRDLFGDVNGDGRPDVITIWSDGHAYVRMNVFDGTKFSFSTSSNLWGSGFGERHEVKLGDFNGDGKIDLIQFSSNDNAYVSLSTGESFVAQPNFVAYGTDAYQRSQIADVNGDGKSDIVRFQNPDIQNDGDVEVWLANDTGTGFLDKQWWSYSGGGYDKAILADVNGDSRMDLIYHEPDHPEGDSIFVELSDGTHFRSSPEDRIDVSSLNLGSHASIQTGDFNGDGRADLVIFDRDNTPWDPTYYVNHAYFWLSTGRGPNDNQPMLSRASELDYTETNGGAITNDGALYIVEWSFRSRIADFNGDGRSDILNFDRDNDSHFTSSASVRFSRGTSWNRVDNYISDNGMDGFNNITISDFDGDGRADVALGQGAIWLSNYRKVNDKVSHITDGYKKVVDINYKPLTADGADPGEDTSNGLDPLERPYFGALYVVSDYGISDGISANLYQYTKHYTNPRFSYNYGFLGFESIGTHDDRKDIFTTNFYYQSFPLTGMNQKETRSVCSDLTHSCFTDLETDFTWSKNSYPGISGTKFYRINMILKQHLESELDNVGSKNESTQYHYDLYQNLLEQDHYTDLVFEFTHNHYDLDNIPSWTLGMPTSTQYEYQSGNSAPQIVTTTRTFDVPHRVPSLETTSWLDSGNTKNSGDEYHYDNFGNLLTDREFATNATDRTSTNVYDSIGHFLTDTYNPLNQVVHTDYEGKFGNVHSRRDLNNLETVWVYDGFGRMINEARPDGTVTNVTYCPTLTGADPEPPLVTQSFVKTTNTGEPTQAAYYDALKREIRRTKEGFDGTLILNDTQYDDKLNIRARSEPYYKGSPIYNTTYLYDILNRVSQITYPSGTINEITRYGGAPLKPNSIYSSAPSFGWQMVEVTSGDQRTKTTVFDEFDRAVQVQEKSTFDFFAPLLGLSTYLYDSSGDLYKIQDAAGNITTINSDDNHNTLSINDPDTHTTSFTNDGFGQMLSKLNANGNTFTYTYDLLGRMTTRTQPSISAPTPPLTVHSWNWDASANGIGMLASVTTSDPENFQATYSYDSFSRLAGVNTTPGPGSPLLTTAFGYDLSSRFSDLSYPGTVPMTVHYGYTPTGYLNTVTLPGTGTLWTANAQTARNQVSDFTYGNGYHTVRTYEPALGGVLTINSNTTPSSAPLIQSDRYYYDELGRITNRENTYLGAGEGIGYDELSRVVTTQSCTNSSCNLPITIGYDAIGNITNKSDQGTYTYGQSGAGPHAVTTVSGAHPATFAYDQNGNMTDSNSRHIVWNLNNQIFTLVGGSSQAYLYDPSGQKVWKRGTSGGPTTITRYAGKIYERIGNNGSSPTNEHRFVYADGHAIAVVSGAFTASQLQYLHYDNLGSVELITPGAGGAAEGPMSFDPFGRRRAANFSPPPLGGFSTSILRGFSDHDMIDSQNHDELIDMRARMYDPQYARFISPDPLVGSLSNTQALNRYSYVSNNPVNLIDPLGLIGEELAGNAVGSAAGASATGSIGGGIPFGDEMASGAAHVFTAYAVESSAQSKISQALDKLANFIVDAFTDTYTGGSGRHGTDVYMYTAKRELTEKQRFRPQGVIKARRNQESDNADVAGKTNRSEAAMAARKADETMRPRQVKSIVGYYVNSGNQVQSVIKVVDTRTGSSSIEYGYPGEFNFTALPNSIHTDVPVSSGELPCSGAFGFVPPYIIP